MNSRILSRVNDPNHQKEREALKQAIRTYAQRLLKFDDEGRARTQILYRPDDAYVASQFLPLPPVTYRGGTSLKSRRQKRTPMTR